MIKYIIKNLPLPNDIIDNIYSYLDLLVEIKRKDKIWFKRLITDDFYLYSRDDCPLTKYLLDREEGMLKILLKNNAYNLINNIHYSNLKIR
jgi:hypothetical protein